ncbi:hypothetical protein ABTD07_19935, partial [Acinetobacter baumannii]
RFAIPRNHRPSDARTAYPGAVHGAVAHSAPVNPAITHEFQNHNQLDDRGPAYSARGHITAITAYAALAVRLCAR